MLVKYVTVGAALTLTTSQHLQSRSEAVVNEAATTRGFVWKVKVCNQARGGGGRREATDGLTLRLSCLAPWEV